MKQYIMLKSEFIVMKCYCGSFILLLHKHEVCEKIWVEVYNSPTNYWTDLDELRIVQDFNFHIAPILSINRKQDSVHKQDSFIKYDNSLTQCAALIFMMLILFRWTTLSHRVFGNTGELECKHSKGVKSLSQ